MARPSNSTPRPDWLDTADYTSLAGLDLYGWAAMLASLQVADAQQDVVQNEQAPDISHKARDDAYGRWHARRQAGEPLDLHLRGVIELISDPSVASSGAGISEVQPPVYLGDQEVLLKVDLNVPADVLKAQFSSWLETRKVPIPRRPGKATPDTISPGHLKDFYTKKIVPYWDVMYWAKYNGYKPTLTEIGEWLWPESANPERQARQAKVALQDAFRLFRPIIAQADAVR